MAENSHISPPEEHTRDKKRIVLLTYGSRGDVEPFVALGMRLIHEGFSVRLIAPQPFKSLTETTGIEFICIDSDPDELGQMFANRAGGNWFKMIKSMADHVMPIAKNVFETIIQFTHDADLIIHSFMMTDAGHTIAQQKGIPDISAQFFPVFLATKEFPAVALPDLPLGETYRFTMHKINTFMFRHSARFMYHKLQKSTPELPDLAPWPFSGVVEKQPPIVFAYSRHVLPKPNDWPANAHVSGYWQLPISNNWSAPKELIEFLQQENQPIFFGPGSMQSKRSNVLLEMVIRAARNHDKRVVLGVSVDDVPNRLKGEDIICVKGVPYHWLFPRMRYVIHHGGAGTSGTAVTAGVPNSAIPFSVDQTFWAKRLVQLGVGPGAPPIKKITVDTLEKMILDATENSEYSRQAKILAEKISQEDGINTTINIIKILLFGF